MEITKLRWRMRLTGWGSNGPHTLHFQEVERKPTMAETKSYVEGLSDRIDSTWEYVTVEVQSFFEVKNY